MAQPHRAHPHCTQTKQPDWRTKPAPQSGHPVPGDGGTDTGEGKGWGRGLGSSRGICICGSCLSGGRFVPTPEYIPKATASKSPGQLL